MKLNLFQVDAFVREPFSGNPAAVVPLDEWIGDALMQRIAAENNLSETAFFVPRDGDYDIRWFTPAAEVELCGHATLASAFVLFLLGSVTGDAVKFSTRKRGDVSVTRKGDLLILDFPADTATPMALPEAIAGAVNRPPIQAFRGKTDLMLIYDSQEDVEALAPDFPRIAAMDARAVMVTAPGRKADFVSRFFAPRVGVPEDPATGSAHTTLVPYWSKRLGKDELTGIQLSSRKGYFHCRHHGDRVAIGGKARLFLKGNLYLD